MLAWLLELVPQWCHMLSMYDACETANYGQLQGINCVRNCGHGSCASVRASQGPAFLRKRSAARTWPGSNAYLFNQARRRSQCLASSASTMPCLSSASFPAMKLYLFAAGSGIPVRRLIAHHGAAFAGCERLQRDVRRHLGFKFSLACPP